MSNELAVTAEWDPDAKVWVATSDDVPGLATEAATLEALAQKLRVMVPELLALNMPKALIPDPVRFRIDARRHDVVPAE
jgi:hypothetical protein